MDTVSKLTVYFEEPFWVGVFERMENGKLSVCKVTFGAEPKIMKSGSSFSSTMTGWCSALRLHLK